MSNQVYVCQFALDRVQQYDMEASVKGSGLMYPEIRGILGIGLETETPEVKEKKKKYFPFALELEKTNHFAIQSKIIPNALWVGIYQNEAIKLPTHEDYIFSIWSGGRIFNPSCAAILKQHRLGENILTPVQIYDLSTGCLASDETYYFLNLYERRMCVCETQTTPRLKPRPYIAHGFRIAKSVFYDGELNIDKHALNCDVDLWHDRRLLGHFFMSANLHDALSEAGMIDKFKPYTCNLV